MIGKLAGKRILVVEDEYYLASDIQAALRGEGAVVVGPVGQLEPGLALALAGAIDGAVLDINLRGIPSYPLIDRLAEHDVPCLLVTGYDGWSIPEVYRTIRRLEKPCQMTSIVDAVAQLIAHR
ncbi:DNA-binding NtrC family response regulator [Sphingomonas zeicaulis]|uniref:response regulator n=1 Tax=Sphingomonas zeicaulis TaxID=1632740 RepID=UPI003D1A42D0